MQKKILQVVLAHTFFYFHYIQSCRGVVQKGIEQKTFYQVS